jgi:hypothetical protein
MVDAEGPGVAVGMGMCGGAGRAEMSNVGMCVSEALARLLDGVVDEEDARGASSRTSRRVVRAGSDLGRVESRVTRDDDAKFAMPVRAHDTLRQVCAEALKTVRSGAAML